MEIPLIETARLRLRGYRREDFFATAAMWSDPIINRYTTGKPLEPEVAWAKTLRNAGLWPVLGHGYWAIEEKSSGEFVGETGFADFHRDIEPSIVGLPELGYVLCSRAHGKGYAIEAVRAAIDWIDRQLQPQRTVCLIHEGNAASIRLAEKCGYREFHRAQYKGNSLIMLERKV
ncbi:MAG TPA: GNAT family N-acetyltransferase [Terriglobales bacterium]|nr:GNAT family N-acetyltransferase [Terriglobales bacterium]